MFNALAKKSKSNKGFTLIELIVVIAILAILALLLVPRFAGFTDRAKISSDNSTAKTIVTATSTLIANGELKVTSGNGTIDIPDSGAWSSTNLTGSALGADNGKTAMEGLIGTGHNAQQTTSAGFRVTINGSTSEVTVGVY